MDAGAARKQFASLVNGLNNAGTEEELEEAVEEYGRAGDEISRAIDEAIAGYLCRAESRFRTEEQSHLDEVIANLFAAIQVMQVTMVAAADPTVLAPKVHAKKVARDRADRCTDLRRMIKSFEAIGKTEMVAQVKAELARLESGE